MELLDPNESPHPEYRSGDLPIQDHGTERDDPEEEESYHPDYLEVRFYLSCGTVKKIFLEEREQVVEIMERYEEAVVAGKNGVMSFPGRTSYTVQYEGDLAAHLISRDVTVMVPISKITLIEADLGESARPMELAENEQGQIVARYKSVSEE